ncbi:LPXTG cell wall anchor domain-containing protein [Streptococcus hillyeri]|uniref:LPXTG cell wall anchor domain-containing protein n=1 Tax=Streptococcus hillyeri TaxID=2282420 RepID=A0A3L9DUC3_9STRE|nr:LPXTG cell wall anchor domain-containing protein [Streptococcus hillyeri]RLY03954.1 LPXTG cell wall anchor domain-containing protein [Streptococcus hillyeri]
MATKESNNTTAETTSAKLPETGEQFNFLALLGWLLLSVFSWITFGDKKKDTN